ncbi:hypothetical protein M9458_052860, partial [Cirrhinus mrigala]
TGSWTPPQSFDPRTPPRLIAPSSPPWPITPLSPPGSLIPLAPPWSVVDHLPPRDSTLLASSCHFVPLALGSCCFASALQILSVAQAPRLLSSVWVTIHAGIVTGTHTPGSSAQVSSIAPPSCDSVLELRLGWVLVVHQLSPLAHHPSHHTAGSLLAPSSFIASLVLPAPSSFPSLSSSFSPPDPVFPVVSSHWSPSLLLSFPPH